MNTYNVTWMVSAEPLRIRTATVQATSPDEAMTLVERRPDGDYIEAQVYVLDSTSEWVEVACYTGGVR